MPNWSLSFDSLVRLNAIVPAPLRHWMAAEHLHVR